MEQELLKLLIQGGTATAVIVGLIIFVKILTGLISVIKNKNGNPNLEKRIHKIETNDLTELRYVIEKLDVLEKEFYELKGRVSVLESKIK